MKGQVFTAAKIHYINGVVYFTAQKEATDLQTLADNSDITTKSGNVKHPLVRVRTLARLAQGLCLLNITHDKKVHISDLRKEYYKYRSDNKWSLSHKQKEILGTFILSDYYRTETIYAITSLFKLIRSGYRGKKLANQFAIEIGKDEAWQSDITYQGFTQFGMNYIDELGLNKIDETNLLLKDLSNDIKYQDSVNLVQPIKIPEGKLPRPMPKKIGDSERYQSNPRRSKTALVAADFRCEFDDSHYTFISSSTKKPYMEAHHLIPMSEQSSQQYDIDVPENILCVCPTCHRKIHLAEVTVRETLLKQVYDIRAHRLKQRGITIDLNTLVSIYTNDKMT